MVPLNKIKLRIKPIGIGFPALLLLLMTAIITGCGGTKNAAKSGPEFDPTELNTFYNQLNLLEMKGKIKVSMIESGESYNANLTIREKDSKLWFIIKFIGIEFFRGLIDEEKIQILDRNGKEHLTATWQEVQTKYNKELSYETFRNLLLGNPFLVKGVNYGFFKKEGIYEYDYTSEASQLLISIIFKKRLKESHWVLENDKIAIEAKYDQYDSPTLENIPYFRQYIVYFHNTQPINIQMEIKNYSFDDTITIPFEVPDRYSRSDLVVR